MTITPDGNIERWTLRVCPHCHSDWGPADRYHPMYCESCKRDIPGRKLEPIEAVPASQLQGAVDLLAEARDWIDAAGDFMARPMDLLDRMDVALPDYPRGRQT